MLSDPSCNALITQDAGKGGKYTQQSWMFTKCRRGANLVFSFFLRVELILAAFQLIWPEHLAEESRLERASGRWRSYPAVAYFTRNGHSYNG